MADESGSDPLQAELCAAKLAALAAPERLRILRLLRQRPHNVGEIGEALGIPLVNLSHHLSVLRQNQLVHWTKSGRFVTYELPAALIQQIDGTECLDLGCCQLQVPGLSGSTRSTDGGGDQRKE
ncbi:ArsR/SmtB family transcription factor [Tuwongella immobilis]|uniref:HTH arsR-type domain-containing protein n=1 Tax=Tuwongella immobilis TaxID=692036 RepID=A0A6C2YKB2_9BACT|nr:metalloregulator ArsR/SmtB family transcription factor [Tuwongella immobilis]VIP01669.1 family transcriptional regulator : Transcriptional regulator, ArsR family OS=Pirellula staleyi (strain ATCC 27377 / DSM 6068 / ICPB 4128) GN=Psta_1414 PE=4 SV=1: HTH_20 [Tuwongella immobilis]VTR99095.1 family transcriptional regulator : Transcriptional regulator, ArsR family OS=Pirellula staleyi (strain ATCC 27377 / DSM 6068 / ICPB 4128) GN=Psta_1414 PE=4 SV=1: HTH_20 [Tuwongella immobilis]